MHVDDEKIFLENIEEFVMDEGKLVTYKWLSATLDIHVNTAKQLLYKYVMPDNIRKEGVHMTYLLGGILRNGCGMKIQIVRENDLDKAKSKFKLITSEHVYSVQSLDPLSDLNIFYGIDNLKSDKNYEDKLGAIVYKNAIRRPSDNTASLESNVQSKVDKSSGPFKVTKEPQHLKCDPDKANTAAQLDVNPVVEGQSSRSFNGDTITSEPEPLQSVSTKSTTSRTDLATNAGKIVKKSNSVTGSNKPSTKVAKSGIAMLFSKQNAKQNKPIKAVGLLPDSKNNGVEAVNEETAVEDKETQPAERSTAFNREKTSSTKEESKANLKIDALNEGNTKLAPNKKEKIGKINNRSTSSQQSSSRSRKKSSEDNKKTKKRKRIVVMSDSASSDDDMFGRDSDTEVQPPSPEPLPETQSKTNSSDEDMIPPTPVVEKDTHTGRIRKRKLVDQSYEGEDGFLITKKEYVFENCIEDDNDKGESKGLVPVNNCESKTASACDNSDENGKNNDVNNKQARSEQPPSKKKKSLPLGPKTKQSNIMNFFSKS